MLISFACQRPEIRCSAKLSSLHFLHQCKRYSFVKSQNGLSLIKQAYRSSKPEDVSTHFKRIQKVDLASQMQFEMLSLVLCSSSILKNIFQSPDSYQMRKVFLSSLHHPILSFVQCISFIQISGVVLFLMVILRQKNIFFFFIKIFFCPIT